MTGSTATATTDTLETLRGVVAASDDRKAFDLKVLDLSKVSDFTDYFVLCTGRSERQVQAIADAIRERLAGEGVRPLHDEGRRGGRWVLLDYADFVVHVFDRETREFYALERLWIDAPDVTEELRRAG